MRQFKNTSLRYGVVAMLFHWIMAILIIGMLALGLYMSDLPKGLLKLKYYGWHKEIGLTILGLVTLRVVWWIYNVRPILSDTMPAWQRFAARTVHFALYICMFAMPLTGWLMSSAAGVSVSFFGLFVMPDLISPDVSARILFKILHQWIAYGFIAAICGHTLAALHHHFIVKDDILKRMLP